MKYLPIYTIIFLFVFVLNVRAEQGNKDISFYTGQFDIKDAKGDDEYDVVEGVDVQNHDVAHLGDSDYDNPGTVELELNRKTFRVGQSFISPDGDSFYTISTILPIPRKAMW